MFLLDYKQSLIDFSPLNYLFIRAIETSEEEGGATYQDIK